MEDCDNAEINMCIIENIDFCADKVAPGPIADDLAFIMENAAIHENEMAKSLKIPDIKIASSSDDDSETEDSDSDSDVQIVKVTKKTKKIDDATICITSDTGSCDDEKDEAIDKTEELNFKVNPKKDDQIIFQLLEELIVNVDRICSGKDGDNDGDNSSSEDDEEDDEIDKNLISIMNDEEKIADNIPKVRNEVLPEELPEDDETITLKSEDHLLQVGIITNIVETMIVIEGDQNAPALDSDTAFFLDRDTYLGKVFDTFGPVKTPYYSIRLSNRIDKSKVQPGTKVYFVPFNQDITKYIFVEQLKKLKGSDASWKDDCEPPPEHVDYSDDEEEHLMRKVIRDKRKEQKSNERIDAVNNANSRATEIGQKRSLKPRRVYKHHGNALLEHAIQTNNSLDSKSNTNNNSARSMYQHNAQSPTIHNNTINKYQNDSLNLLHSNWNSTKMYHDGNNTRPSQYHFQHQMPLDSYVDGRFSQQTTQQSANDGSSYHPTMQSNPIGQLHDPDQQQRFNTFLHDPEGQVTNHNNTYNVYKQSPGPERNELVHTDDRRSQNVVHFHQRSINHSSNDNQSETSISTNPYLKSFVDIASSSQEMSYSQSNHPNHQNSRFDNRPGAAMHNQGPPFKTSFKDTTNQFQNFNSDFSRQINAPNKVGWNGSRFGDNDAPNNGFNQSYNPPYYQQPPPGIENHLWHPKQNMHFQGYPPQRSQNVPRPAPPASLPLSEISPPPPPPPRFQNYQPAPSWPPNIRQDFNKPAVSQQFVPHCGPNHTSNYNSMSQFSIGASHHQPNNVQYHNQSQSSWRPPFNGESIRNTRPIVLNQHPPFSQSQQME